MYETPAINGDKTGGGDPQYYAEVKSGTTVSFHKKDLAALDEVEKHYEVDDGCNYEDIDKPSQIPMEYEQPGVIFTTNALGKEIRTAVSCT